MKLGCFPTFFFLGFWVLCLCWGGRQGEGCGWKSWSCVSLISSSPPAALPTCPANPDRNHTFRHLPKPDMWCCHFSIMNQFRFGRWKKKKKERERLKIYAQAIETRLQNGVKVILKPFYLSRKKLHIITLRISHFSSAVVAQRNVKCSYLTGTMTTQKLV